MIKLARMTITEAALFDRIGPSLGAPPPPAVAFVGGTTPLPSVYAVSALASATVAAAAAAVSALQAVAPSGDRRPRGTPPPHFEASGTPPWSAGHCPQCGIRLRATTARATVGSGSTRTISRTAKWVDRSARIVDCRPACAAPQGILR